MKTQLLKSLALAVAIAAPASGWCQSAAHDALKKGLVAGKWEEVGSAASALMKDRDWQTQASALRGYVALVRGDGAAAVTHLRKANFAKASPVSTSWLRALADTNADNAIVQFAAGDALQRSGDTKSALARFDQALKLQPDFPVARLARATLRAMNGARAEALADLDRLTTTPVAADALTLRGLVLIEQSDYANAGKDLNRAIDIAPTHAVAYNTKGILQARQNHWPEAAQAFEKAFKLAPDLVEARVNFQIARVAEDRGSALQTKLNLGVFVPGINSEADFKYAAKHAGYLFPSDKKAYLYVAFIGDNGTYPTNAVNKAIAGGMSVVVVDPKKTSQADRQIGAFIKDSLAAGTSPMILVDFNKVIPTQLSNTKSSTIDIPANLIANANATFQSEAAKLGVKGSAVGAAHSDGTWPMLAGSILAAQNFKPFDKVMVESPRSETLLKTAVDLAPKTSYNAVLPIRGDLFTFEAQALFITGDKKAYEKTINNFKYINAPNYKLTLIENPSAPSPSLSNIAGAHGDAADYDRPSSVSFWRGNQQIGSARDALGKVLNPVDRAYPSSTGNGYSTETLGGVSAGAVDVVVGEGGRVEFKTGGSGTLKLINTLYGTPPVPSKNDAPRVHTNVYQGW